MSKTTVLLLFVLIVGAVELASSAQNVDHLIDLMRPNPLKLRDYEQSIKRLIGRVIDNAHDLNDFVVVIDPSAFESTGGLDSFTLEMIDHNRRLRITANSPVAAAWGFNYYLKYYANSSVYWSGKNININNGSLPIVSPKVRVTAKDYVRFNQNVCTYSYSYVWWDAQRWEYEIDWMALNGINLAYAHTGAEYAWVNVLAQFGLSDQDIDEFMPGPAYLAWFRMGNLKRFGGPLPISWHITQGDLQAWILQRYRELGIRYALPAFAGFVPDKFRSLFPTKNFTNASDWIGFNCKFSCLVMVDPIDPLFQQVGDAFNREVVRLYGSSDFFSADVFNEMPPSLPDLNYLATVNRAVYDSIAHINPNAVWVMQAWLFLDPFWTPDRVHAFLCLVPIGRLLLLDLYSETRPLYTNYSSYYGHLFVWNFLHDFGGANGLFGDVSEINLGPDAGRAYPNSSMVGIGLTMEGINQNEFLYEFMLEKSWRPALTFDEMPIWVQNFTVRRYTRPNSTPVHIELRSAWFRIISVLYNTRDYQIKQFFTKRPSLESTPPDLPDSQEFLNAWDDLVAIADSYRNSSLFKYDLVDVSKEALRFLFNQKFLEMKSAWQAQDLYAFNEKSAELVDILNDMEILLASDKHFLLANWLESAKSLATNYDERNQYEWNARTQITLWGANYTSNVFDYACKAWSGLVVDYYIPRWQVLIDAARRCLLDGSTLDPIVLNERILEQVELPFISAKKLYPTTERGDSFEIVRDIHNKYRYPTGNSKKLLTIKKN